MALPAKKGSADMLIALGGPKGLPTAEGEESEAMVGDEEAPGMDSVKSMAADDVFDAIANNDRELFADAFDRYVKACI